ncbi:protease [Klebsiella phage K64-1]|uniref:protease n=1 Tax=Klebsiella phage K64-1 TaxID=1439894 RepID=UPI00248B89F8|nr:protease [Klebsiella phage K64-1]
MFIVLKEFLYNTLIAFSLIFPSHDIQQNVTVNDSNVLIFNTKINDESVQRAETLYKKYKYKTISITSPGGDVNSGFELAVFASDHNIKVNVPKYCASACTVIFFAADKQNRVMDKDAIIAIHNVSVVANNDISGNETISINTAMDLMKDTSEIVAAMYSLYAYVGIPGEILMRTSTMHGADSYQITKKQLQMWGILEK